MAHRAASVYAVVSDEVKDGLPSGKYKADLRRSRSVPGTASSVERVLEDVEAFTLAGDVHGAFAESLILAIRDVQESTRARQLSIAFAPLDVEIEAGRADAAEEVVELEARATGFRCPRTVRRLIQATRNEIQTGYRRIAALIPLASITLLVGCSEFAAPERREDWRYACTVESTHTDTQVVNGMPYIVTVEIKYCRWQSTRVRR